MENIEFAKLFEIRTKQFAISIIKLSSIIKNSEESRVIKNQITKSATSIGANYREANRAKSRRDFTHKIKICEGESSETLYWLELIHDLNWVEENRILPIMKEASEILAILTTISKSLSN